MSNATRCLLFFLVAGLEVSCGRFLTRPREYVQEKQIKSASHPDSKRPNHDDSKSIEPAQSQDIAAEPAAIAGTYLLCMEEAKSTTPDQSSVGCVMPNIKREKFSSALKSVSVKNLKTGSVLPAQAIVFPREDSRWFISFQAPSVEVQDLVVSLSLNLDGVDIFLNSSVVQNKTEGSEPPSSVDTGLLTLIASRNILSFGGAVSDRKTLAPGSKVLLPKKIEISEGFALKNQFAYLQINEHICTFEGNPLTAAFELIACDPEIKAGEKSQATQLAFRLGLTDAVPVGVPLTLRIQLEVSK